MASKLPYTAIPIDDSFIKMISNQATKLIEEIQKDIANEKEISDRTYKACNTILQDIQQEYLRIQIEFIEETQILITKALQEPNKRFHETWLQIFDMYAGRCHQITGPILQVLNSVASESKRLQNKYRLLLAGTTAFLVVFTVFIGGLVLHFLPEAWCCFTLTAGGLALAADGALLAAGLAIACVIGAMNTSAIRAVYDRCTSELQTLLTKHLPCLFNVHKNTVTSAELQQAIKDSIDTFKIKEDVWINIDTLEMLKRSTVRELYALKQKVNP
ncbi:unnamed protein product [Adineta ricciae]|uniref:Uncharacterized protein n=1 Tax=Adineta ricciae TaxID=249248 RepID=A0A816A4I2_ADIRI|nr:unnamed protein product [Adineta ricciae]CAF1590976.1 unnamed protein product [Adineta ricciae]